MNTGVPVSFTNTTSGGYIGVPETYQWFFEGATPATSTDKDPVVVYDNCGTFDVMLIVDRGSQIDTITKADFMQVGPVVNIIAEPGLTACWYQTITLDATTPGAVSYLWTPGGATTPTIDVTYAEYGIGAHDFSVTVNTGSCDATKEVSTYLDACTAIGEKNNGVSVSVFPNPSNGEFTLELNSAKSVIADMSITNSLGMKVYAEKNVSVNGKVVKNLSLSNLSSRIYLLTLQNGDLKITQKIFIK